MARIRSTHPAQWTDEEFVQCTPLARLLCLALRNEADDNGVFEWKPVTIKMKLLPADDCDVPALLAELVKRQQVKKFEADQKNYGAIRNFCKFQRPKSPKPVFPLPKEMEAYVVLHARNAASETDSAPMQPAGNECEQKQGDNIISFPPQFSNGSEIPPQMKEEGGKGNAKEEKKDFRTKKRISYPQTFEDLWKSYPTDALMGKKQAFDAWKKLDAEDQSACFESVPAFVAHCKSHPDYRPIHLCRYISQRRFDGFLERGRQIAQLNAGVFIKYESPQWNAWAKWYRARGEPMPVYSQRSMGRRFPSEYPPNTQAAE